ncbi:DNA-processing protein DprA [Allofournierella sp.]|uniref:DNA-processing protein DprA n=2 Tax=Allofournierella sp. TaxID=1940256 RepID=UPI003AB1B01E
MTGQTLEWLWLAHVLGPGARGCGGVLALYPTPGELLEAVGREDLSGLLAPAQAERLEAKPENFEKLARSCEKMGVQIVTMAEAAYPARLRDVPDAPPVLFCTGDTAALNRTPAVGMIGSRRPSAYGVEAAACIGGQLAEAGVCLVSGLADGLDSEAHRAAVRCGAPTVGVLGTAIDKTYPAANAALRRQVEGVGAVISEFAPGDVTRSAAFLLRNRLIAALADAVCVVEAREKSGTMNTVGHAERYGRPVYAVPGGIFSELCGGTNRLLAEGRARAASGAGVILEGLGLAAPAPAHTQKRQTQTEPLGPAAKEMLRHLGQQPKGLEILAGEARCEAGEALAALLELELAGLAQSCAGGQYRRK